VLWYKSQDWGPQAAGTSHSNPAKRTGLLNSGAERSLQTTSNIALELPGQQQQSEHKVR